MSKPLQVSLFIHFDPVSFALNVLWHYLPVCIGRISVREPKNDTNCCASESRSMWKDIGADIGIPAKVAEALVWEIGEKGIEERANRLVSLPFIQSVMPSQRQGHPRPSQFQVHTRARRVPKRKADDMS